MSFSDSFSGVFVGFGLLIHLGLEKLLLSILIHTMKGHFSSCKGVHVLVEKSYQKVKWNNRKVSGTIRLSDLDNNPSPISHPILPEKMAPCFPVKFSLAGNAWRERLTLHGHGTGVEMFLNTAESIYEQSHKSLRLVWLPTELSDIVGAMRESGHSELGLTKGDDEV